MESFSKDDLIALTNSTGDELTFVLADIIPYEGGEYAVLLEADVDDDGNCAIIEEAEAVILRLMSSGSAAEGEDDDIELHGLGEEEQALLDSIYAAYLKRIQG